MSDAAKAQGSVSWEKAQVQSQTTTIIIADDHPLFRGALRQAVASITRAWGMMEATDCLRAPRNSGWSSAMMIVVD